jgi:acetate kinase
MDDALLVLNAGASSIKFALFAAAGLRRLAGGAIGEIGSAPHLVMRDTGGATLQERRWPHGAALSHEALLGTVLDAVEAHLGGARLIAAGHRIVHGGARFTGPALLDAPTIAALTALTPLAPLHEPHNLAAVAAVAALRPGLKQIGCFDTSFHHTIPAARTRLPLPREFFDQGVRRYGFHGLSYEYIAGAFAALAPARAAGATVALHLGAGASACALRGGQSVDSSMGFTALDGLIMGTRCGSIDAGVILYLLQSDGMSAADVTDLLYKKSGLLGLSGLSSDMRVLLASAAPAAAEAVAAFTIAAATHVAGLAVSLGGLETIIFTGGIGEHAAPVRSGICRHLAWLGIALDEAANARNDQLISATASRLAVYVIPTNEELMIARHCEELLGQ